MHQQHPQPVDIENHFDRNAGGKRISIPTMEHPFPNPRMEDNAKAGLMGKKRYLRKLAFDTIASRHAWTVGPLTIVRMTPDSGYVT
jgi:hypothetical protein